MEEEVKGTIEEEMRAKETEQQQPETRPQGSAAKATKEQDAKILMAERANEEERGQEHREQAWRVHRSFSFSVVLGQHAAKPVH